MKIIKYIDLFAGVGGFRYGIEMAARNIVHNKSRRTEKSNPETRMGFNCVYSNEWDKYANSVYKKHYGECDSRDIREVKTSEIPDFDLLVGGFPCQSFSIAGKRQGFCDTRGTLFFEIARIIKQKQPRFLLLENVKGLLSHDKGSTFATIISTLDELGYDAQWQVLNSKNFGVPQNRERIFIVGYLRGTGRPKVFPIFGTNKKDIIQVNKPKHSNNRIYSDDGLSPTLNTAQGGMRQPKINGVKIRRLTPIECERLQGFPDNWTKYDVDGKEVSDTQRYKMMGNAVTTNVISFIIGKLS